MRRLALLLLTMSVAFILPMGCETKTVPPVNEVTYASKLSEEPVLVQTIAVGGASEEAVREAILAAASNREWTVTEMDNGDIQTQLTHRSSESTLTFRYRAGFIEVYSVSYKIDKKTLVRIEREEPDDWIRNLHKDILVNLGLLTTS